jgi:hypothetical protein
MAPVPDTVEVKHLVPNNEVPRNKAAGVPVPVDTVVQSAANPARSPDLIGFSFDGTGVSNSAPPDTTGRPGKNHYVQWVNTKLAVYDKRGNLLFGPVKGNTLFQSLGGTCATHNDGDPIVEYDILADRWMLTQFAVGATDGSFSHQCIAVSMSGDPLGAYYLYDFRTSSSTDPKLFVDYPHVGVWPDGYYITTHQFGTDPGFQGLYVYDRAAMLAGLPSSFQFYNFGASAPAFFVYGGALPADLDSLTPPPAGAPMTVVQFGSPDSDGSTGYVVHTWKVKTTWGSTPSLQITGPVDVPVAPFNPELCTPFLPVTVALGSRPCVPQPIPMAPAGATPYTPVDIWLDGIGDRLMYRVAYRNYGDHESIVLNHTVNATGHQAGIRWYELRNPSTSPTLYQQGTYIGATPDLQHRWMGSMAMDNGGNILLGYSKSGPTLLSEIDVAGRKADDPPGSLGPEILMKASGGSQIATGNRWGDYSTMTVDPYDGCTFWYSTEYIPSDGSFNWRTRVGSFKYSTCTAPAQGVISGVVNDCATGAPMSRALVSVSNGFSGATDANGRYSIIVPPGSYTVSASAPGRLCAASRSYSVTVSNGGTATRNFCLTGSPKFDFSSYTLDDSAGSNNGTINKDECVKLPVTVRNNGCGVGTHVSATLSTGTPGVTVNQNKATIGTVARDTNATSAPFSFSTSSAGGFQCGAPIDFTLALASDQGATTLHFSVPTCAAASITKSGAIDGSEPQQNARLGRDSNAASCASAKVCPASLGTGTRSVDTYTFANTSSVQTCVTVNVTADASCNGNNQIFSAAYLDRYDPQNLCTNYLADEGQSPDLGYNAYSFEVPAGRTFVVVVNAVQAGGLCPNYNLNVSGLVDDVTAGKGACPAPPVVNCIEDNDPQIAYGRGWHLINNAQASGGHFRLNGRKEAGTAASLGFNVPAGSTGAVTYNYAKSPRGGSADVWLDGAFRETVSYAGATGSTLSPQFGASVRYANLAAGAHRFELRNTRGGVIYLDGICLESAATTATPAVGPGPTTTASGTAAAGQPLVQDVNVPAGAESLSIVAEGPAGVPIQLVVISPDGVTLATSDVSTDGLAVLDVPVSQSGVYTVQAINLSLGTVQVWTAATPLVAR